VAIMENLKPVLEGELARLMKLAPGERLTQRRARLANYGPVKEAA
jgi:acetyl-CoA carboxylase alpha subunit